VPVNRFDHRSLHAGWLGAGANLGYDLNENLTGFTGIAGGATYNGQEDYVAYGYDTAGRLNSIVTDISVDLSGNSLISTAFSVSRTFLEARLKPRIWRSIRLQRSPPYPFPAPTTTAAG